MTEQEAIKHLELCKKSRLFIPTNDVLDMAIKALEEVEQYRKIGTVEGYNRALKSSLENYLLYMGYKEKVKAYEDAEEQGLLLRLPCKVGTKVWFIREITSSRRELIETEVEKVISKKGGLYIKLLCNSFYETTCNSIGKTVFLTRKEAEQALAEMQKG